jgi:hypothetical protein
MCAIILVGLLLCLVRQAPYNGGTGVMVHDKLILWIDVYVVANCCHNIRQENHSQVVQCGGINTAISVMHALHIIIGHHAITDWDVVCKFRW